jgi:hypothetical protein
MCKQRLNGIYPRIANLKHSLGIVFDPLMPPCYKIRRVSPTTIEQQSIFESESKVNGAGESLETHPVPLSMTTGDIRVILFKCLIRKLKDEI